MNSLIAPIGAAILIIGTFVLVGMPSARRLAPWMASQLGVKSDADLIAARAAWHRMGLLSGGVLLVLAVALLLSDLDPYLAPVGYVAATIAGSAASVGGGMKRRAELLSSGRETIVLTGLLRCILALSLGLVLAAIFASFELSAQAKHWSGMLSLDSALWPFNIDIRQMIVIASVSVFISALVCACQWVLLQRQSIAGASAQVDSRVRVFVSTRISLAALGGQLMLVGAMLPAIQIFTLHVIGYGYIVSPQADLVGSLLGLVVFAGGLIVSIYAALFPLWIRPKKIHQSVALDNVQMYSTVSAQPSSEDARDDGADKWNLK